MNENILLAAPAAPAVNIEATEKRLEDRCLGTNPYLKNLNYAFFFNLRICLKFQSRSRES